MEDEIDEFAEARKSLNLTVDLYELGSRGNLNWGYQAAEQKQVLRMRTLDKSLVIQITLPDKLFEWFVEIFKEESKEPFEKEKLASTWVDHYGDKDEKLIEEMREEINRFINISTTYYTRIVKLGNSNTFQYFDGTDWRTFDIFQT